MLVVDRLYFRQMLSGRDFAAADRVRAACANAPAGSTTEVGSAIAARVAG